MLQRPQIEGLGGVRHQRQLPCGFLPLVLLCYKSADTPEDNLEGSIVKVR